MRLHYAATSPYVRKVMVAAHELGLADRLDLVETTPGSVIEDVAGDNPLAQIPTLVLARNSHTGHGARLYDSLVICEFLDAMARGAARGGLFPPPGPDRWRALTLHALGHGVIDAAIGRVHERRRPAGECSTSVDAKQRAAILRALDALEREAGALGQDPTIGTIAIGCALGYLDFRFGDEGWRPGRPDLARWYDAFSKRPSMQKTAPPA